MTNTNLLKSKMMAHGDANFVQIISECLGCSRTTASKKLNNEQEFSQSEIKVIAERYSLTAEDIRQIFISDCDGESV